MEITIMVTGPEAACEENEQWLISTSAIFFHNIKILKYSVTKGPPTTDV